jgi:adenosine deaminase
VTSGFADLHRHLDGSIRPSTLTELASRCGKSVPEDLAFFPDMGLEAALSRFAFTLSLLQDPATVERVAHEICEDAEAEGVTTLEIRFAPQLHAGGTPAVVVDAALSGIARRAGLILCGLYGEPPGLLHRLVDIARTRPGAVGIDLAGGPAPQHRWSMGDYAPAFSAAKSADLGRTVHAGEGRPAAEIRMAVEQLHAQRVGHGLTVLDDPSVADLLRTRDITIEACPTSNWHVGAIPTVPDHPLPQWLNAGLKVCINTDNTLLSRTSAPLEHGRVAQMPGITPSGIQTLIDNGHAARFPST